MKLFDGILNKVKEKFLRDSLYSKDEQKVTDNIAKAADKNFGKNKEKDEKNYYKIEVANAQSWNPETHPKGRGDSLHVASFSYDGETKTLVVTYRDGTTCQYDNIPEDMAKEFVRADSKGRWAIKHLHPLPYKVV